MRRLVPAGQRQRQARRRQRLVGVLGGTGLLAVVGLVVALLAAAPAAAAPRPGQVTTKDGQTFEGEIDDASTPGRVDVTIRGIKTSIDGRNIAKVTYFETPKQEFDVRLAKLARDDVSGRVALGKWALEKREYDLALAAWDSARAIDPNSREAADLHQQITRARPTGPSATGPATAPAGPAVTGAAPGDPAAATRPATKPITAKRTVTQEEMNLVRAAEWQQGDPLVKVRIDPNVRQAFMNSGVIPLQEARAMQPQDLAWEILGAGNEQQRKGVQIVTDPKPMFDFKKNVNPVVVTGCATASCHSFERPGATRLLLFPARTDDLAAYSNFVLLQQYMRSQDGVEYFMIDRTRAEFSLLSQYLLPPPAARVPHPNVPAYQGAVKNPAHPHYQAVVTWIGQTLKPVATFDYSTIDLTAPPKTDKPGANRPAAAAAAAGPAASAAGASGGR